MRNRLLFALCLIGCVLLASCSKKDDPVTPFGSVHFSVSNEVSGQPVAMGPVNYTNAAGNQYSVDLLKYLLSNFTLVKEDGSEQHFSNYVLIDASDPDYLHFDLDSVLNGNYKSIRFYVGVDSAHNHTGLQEGALDPVHGMIWTWNTGYIFFKNEGYFMDSTNTRQHFVQHLGMDMSLSTVTIPLSDFKISGDKKNCTLHFDLNRVYGTSTSGRVDFNDNPVRMSDPRDDAFWMITLRNNFGQAFSVGN
jgi:hypothetical protein